MAADLLLAVLAGPGRRRTYNGEATVAATMFVMDVAVILLAFAAVMLSPLRGSLSQGSALAALAAALVLFPAAKYVTRVYPGHGLSRASRLRQVVLAVVLASLVMFAATAAEAIVLDHGGAAWWLTSIGLIALTALLVMLADPAERALLLRRERWCQPVFIFGSGAASSEIVRQLRLYPHLGYEAACIVDDRAVYIPEEEHGIPVVRSQELSRHAAQLRVATTALVVENLVERSLIHQLVTAGIFKTVLVIPEFGEIVSSRSSIRRVGGLAAIGIRSNRPRGLAAAGKRSFDVVAAALALLLTSPLLAVVALLVRLDSPGPVLFSQARWGGSKASFTALKFRSMYADGDRRLRRHFLRNPAAQREYERFRKLTDDPRVTRVGRLMRKTSLDELPQLVNVLRGDMSLVGPRPYTFDELAKLGPAREILSAVRPGITGFWQVSGRNRRTFRERIEMDCYYVRNLSIWLDIWVIYRTFVGIAMREGQ